MSILQNEAKKECKIKKTKITGRSFKKGSSVGGAEKVAADTTGASALIPKIHCHRKTERYFCG